MERFWYLFWLVAIGLLIALISGLFNGAAFLFGQLWLCLLLAFLLGLFLAWLFWGREGALSPEEQASFAAQEKDLATYKGRVDRLESDLVVRRGELSSARAKAEALERDLAACRERNRELKAQLGSN